MGTLPAPRACSLKWVSDDYIVSSAGAAARQQALFVARVQNANFATMVQSVYSVSRLRHLHGMFV
jgi:hypothetical protein